MNKIQTVVILNTSSWVECFSFVLTNETLNQLLRRHFLVVCDILIITISVYTLVDKLIALSVAILKRIPKLFSE